MSTTPGITYPATTLRGRLAEIAASWSAGPSADFAWCGRTVTDLLAQFPLTITTEGQAALDAGPDQVRMERDVLRDELAALVLAVRTWARPSEPVQDACDRADRFLAASGSGLPDTEDRP